MRRRTTARRATWIAALAALAACEGGSTDPEHTIDAADFFLNGGMEWDAGWQLQSPPGTEAAYAERGGVDGSRGLSLSGGPEGVPEARLLVAQRMPAGDVAGRTLTLSARVRLQGVEGPGFALALRGDDPSLGRGRGEAFATTEGRVRISGTADWTEHSVRLDDIDGDIGLVSVYLILMPGTTGTVHVDDVTLTSEEVVREDPAGSSFTAGGDGRQRPPKPGASR